MKGFFLTFNKELVVRLLRYKNALLKLKNLGVMKVFSDNIADTAGVTSLQVRKDFSLLKIAGNKRGGYNINELLLDITSIVGPTGGENIVVVGCGNIGKALINYRGFHSDNFEIIAGFDLSPENVNMENACPIYGMDKLEDFVKEKNIKVAVIAIPDNVAGEIYDKLVKIGVKGFLNFARVNLREIEGVFVNNVNLELYIENLFYYINFMEKEKEL
jgi:redox-sensing transcriptional repressor